MRERASSPTIFNCEIMGNPSLERLQDLSQIVYLHEDSSK